MIAETLARHLPEYKDKNAQATDSCLTGITDIHIFSETLYALPYRQLLLYVLLLPINPYRTDSLPQIYFK